MDVATEHASTNTAISLIKIINERITARTRSQESSSKYKAVICTPDGELHGLSCNMIESPLLSKDSNLLPFCKERSELKSKPGQLFTNCGCKNIAVPS